MFKVPKVLTFIGEVREVEYVVSKESERGTFEARCLASEAFTKKLLNKFPHQAEAFRDLERLDEIQEELLGSIKGAQRISVITRPGYITVDGVTLFASSLGAFGAAGADAAFDVEFLLPKLNLIQVPLDSMSPVDLGNVAREIMRIGSDELRYSVLGLVARSALSYLLPGRLAVMFCGSPATGKTLVSTICQSFYGKDFAQTATSFRSTENAIEALICEFNGVLVTIDEFSPSNTPNGNALRSSADRIIRAVADGQVRERCSENGRLMPGYPPPKSQIVLTGEELPDAESAQERLVILEFNSGTVDLDVAKNLLRRGQSGSLAAVMGNLIRFVLERNSTAESLEARIEELSSEFMGLGAQHRPSRNCAQIQLGVELFAEFLERRSDWTPEDAAQLVEDSRKVIGGLARLQSEISRSVGLADQFLDALSAGFRQHRFHYTRKDTARSGFGANIRGSSTKVGVLNDEGQLCIYPELGLKALNQHLREQGKSSNLTTRVLYSRLNYAGYLVSNREGKNFYRANLDGREPTYICLTERATARVIGEAKGA